MQPVGPPDQSTPSDTPEYIHTGSSALPITPAAQVPSSIRTWGSLLAKGANTSAPGDDRISADTVKAFWKWDGQRIAQLVRACVRLGQHPKLWKTTKGVVIPKPVKPHYTGGRAVMAVVRTRWSCCVYLLLWPLYALVRAAVRACCGVCRTHSVELLCAPNAMAVVRAQWSCYARLLQWPSYALSRGAVRANC